MTAHPVITIVGAGLGGLTLARILQQGGVPVVVHDLDVSPTARMQGGMLDMHEDTGQAALRAAGLYDLFLREVLPGGEATRILDRHAQVLLDQADDGHGGRPEIQREALRALLLDSVTAGTVRWGSRLVEARPLGDGRHELRFDGGTAETPDLLIGADGAWSRIRPLVSDAVPIYSGISFLASRLHHASTAHPQAAALVGAGLLFALGPDKGFLVHREPGDELEVYIAVRTDAGWAAGQTDRDATLRELDATFSGWHEDLRRLFTEADEPFVARAISALPVGHRWDRTAGVTLLGDAAHLMSPFAGEGANLAMGDAADLAAALLKHGVTTPADREAALTDYERVLFPRAAVAAEESAANLKISFRADSPAGLMDVMAMHAAEAEFGPGGAPLTGGSLRDRGSVPVSRR